MKSISKVYDVFLNDKALEDLEDIYRYISFSINEPLVAKRIINKIKSALNELRYFPYSHQIRLEGNYSNKEYRQVMISSYIAIYKIDEANSRVNIITIQYSSRKI